MHEFRYDAVTVELYWVQVGDDGVDTRTRPDWLGTPMYDLICRARNGEDDPWMRRRLEPLVPRTRHA